MNIQALKPNGALHQTWQGERITQSKEWLVVYTPLGTSQKAKAVAAMLMEESTNGQFPFLKVGYEDALGRIEQITRSER